MKEFTYLVQDSVGLHARVAGVLMNLIKDFKSNVYIQNGKKGGNAQRMLGILHLDIKCGDTVRVSVEGPDEEVAFQEIREFFEENL